MRIENFRNLLGVVLLTCQAFFNLEKKKKVQDKTLFLFRLTFTLHAIEDVYLTYSQTSPGFYVSAVQVF